MNELIDLIEKYKKECSKIKVKKADIEIELEFKGEQLSGVEFLDFSKDDSDEDDFFKMFDNKEIQ